MAIDDVDPDEMAGLSLQGHLDAALDNATDKTTKYHIRHAIQLLVEQGRLDEAEQPADD